MAGAGDDVINLIAAAFSQVDFQANLGAGDDRLAITLDPDLLPVEDPTSIVHVNIDAGSGLDGVVLDAEHLTYEELLLSTLIFAVGSVSIDGLFPFAVVEFQRAIRPDSVLANASSLALTLDGPSLAIDVASGVSDDLIRLRTNATADGSVRFSAATGGGDDIVELTASRFNAVSVELDLGAGNDKAGLTFIGGGTPDPSSLQMKLAAGAGDDVIDVAAESFFDVFADVDLGGGNDKGLVEYPSDPHELQLLLKAGDGDDEVEVTGPDVTTGRWDLKLGLGEGHDKAFVEIPSGPSDLILRLLGGLGDDFLETQLGFWPGLRFDVLLDGGAGRDIVRGKVRETPSVPTTALDEVPVPPGGALRFHVLGGGDDDDLALIVDEIMSSSTLLDPLLDGGAGIDDCTASDNVLVVNCEDTA
jgi:hypothetical protein